jgi:hypothetical protein
MFIKSTILNFQIFDYDIKFVIKVSGDIEQNNIIIEMRVDHLNIINLIDITLKNRENICRLSLIESTTFKYELFNNQTFKQNINIGSQNPRVCEINVYKLKIC